jgi:hypothetical protein
MKEYANERNIGDYVGSNGNYDGNDGFSTPHIDNKNKREHSILLC